MGIEKQGAKPTGIIGKIIGRLMNTFHTSLYIEYFNRKKLLENHRILDIGCGGGKFINYLSKKGENLQLFGLDHSAEMIDLTSQLNAGILKQNRLKLIIGSVTNIDISDGTIDLVTAFETVQFWPETETAFAEIFRVLGNNGELLIINRYPKKGTKWWKLARLKSNKDYREILEKTGFKEITIDLDYKKGWIIVSGVKK